MESNPLLVRNTLPRFDDISSDHVVPAIEQVLSEQRSRLEQLRKQQAEDFSWALELEDMRQAVTQAFSPVSHLNNVLSTDELRKAFNECLPKITDFFTELGQDPALLAGFNHLSSQTAVQEDGVRKQLVAHALRDLELAGVGLAEEDKKAFRDLMQRLAKAQAAFEQNLMDATEAFTWHSSDVTELDGLPDDLVKRAAENAKSQGIDGYRLLLDPPTYMAVMSYAKLEELRETFYRAWTTRASDRGPNAGEWDNTPLMEEILSLRHQAAELLGFDNYAALSLATKMAESVPDVIDFLSELAERSKQMALTEKARLDEFAGRTLSAWDVGFYSELLKQKTLGVDEESLRPFFPLGRVFPGLFALAEQLFGIRFQRRKDIAVWHQDVQYFDVLDPEDEVIGGVYVDLYARPNKRGGAWMDECLIRQNFNGHLLRPVAHLVCNFASPGDDTPALLTHRDVVTLFHEFGHTLHHLLTDVDYPSLSGINGVPWDAVELPSQFFENFAWLTPVLHSISGHHKTGQPLGDDIIRKLQVSRTFQAGMQMMRQLEFALFDFRLHAEYDPSHGGRVADVLNQVRRDVSVVETPAYNRFANSFAHVFGGGYAAGYYSYKWAEVLAADAFSAFEEAGPFDPGTASRFKASILSKGGSRDILDGFVEFRGRKPILDPLLQQSGIRP